MTRCTEGIHPRTHDEAEAPVNVYDADVAHRETDEPDDRGKAQGADETKESNKERVGYGGTVR
jgi:hypothetical protein